MGLDDAIHDQRRAEPGSQSQEQHFPVPVAAQPLHGRIIDKLHGAAEGRPEVETKPSLSQVTWFSNRPVSGSTGPGKPMETAS
jgi:hypothetical protein